MFMGQIEETTHMFCGFRAKGIFIFISRAHFSRSTPFLHFSPRSEIHRAKSGEVGMSERQKEQKNKELEREAISEPGIGSDIIPSRSLCRNLRVKEN